ncbi:MAG: hypothetical protein ACLQU2_06115 [Candidatus Binataceae bacterium]
MDVKEAGRRGGNATAKKLTKKQRSENARRAVEARWAKWRKAHHVDQAKP